MNIPDFDQARNKWHQISVPQQLYPNSLLNNCLGGGVFAEWAFSHAIVEALVLA